MSQGNWNANPLPSPLLTYHYIVIRYKIFIYLELKTKELIRRLNPVKIKQYIN